MYNLLANREYMELYFSITTWFIFSSILTPIGYVLQDVVADAMTVEVVEPDFRKNKKNLHNPSIKAEHTMVQLYGRFAIILGSLLVGIINLYVFNNINQQTNDLHRAYANIYLKKGIMQYKVLKLTFSKFCFS